MLQKNYPLKLNRQKNSKSQSIKYNNIPKGKKSQKFKYSPSITIPGDNSTKWGADLKKYKSTSKTISLNSLPKLDSYLITNTNDYIPNSNKNAGLFELFVRNKTSYFKNRDLKDENINDEQFREIELLWDELGITDEYQDQFELYLGTITNIENRQKFLLIEKNNLNKIKEALIKFSKEKNNRIKNIEFLKQLNNNIKQNVILGDKKITKELLKQIIDCIKTIRLNSVNAVNSFIKVRESMNCFSIENKINFEKIYNNFFFDCNYLLKMNSEISFLKYSEIDKIFEKKTQDEPLDTFLTLYNNIIKNENEKISNPISKDLLNAIDKCRYYLIQDSILNNIKTKKILKSNKSKGQRFNNKYKGKSLMTLSNNVLRDYNSNFMDIRLHRLKSELGKDYNNIFLNTNKQRYSNINSPNNKRYGNLMSNQSRKGRSNNIIIERENSPYKFDNFNNLDEINYKNNLDNMISNYELKTEEIEEEKYMDFNGNNNKVINEEKDQNKKNKKYDEEIISINDNNIEEVDKKNENNNDKEKEKENSTNIKEEKKVKDKEKKENEKKIEDDEDNIIVDMDYLDYIKQK